MEKLQRDPAFRDTRPLSASKGNASFNLPDQAKRGFLYSALLPPKLVVLAGFGGAGIDSWDVMSRRTQVMYHHEGSLRPALGASQSSPESKFRKITRRRYSEVDADVARSSSTGVGAMAVFFRILEQRQHQRGDCGNITLVGHSMGAMVLNEGLREFPAVGCSRIVYMAAAASIRDVFAGTVPYIDRHPNVPFYSLSLHPRAEDRERPFGENLVSELVPRGSLLIWIDEFLGHPQSFPDRTFGHFENALLASRMFPPRLQRQVHLTALSVGPGEPRLQHHGDFGGVRFWEPAFYKAPGDVSRDGYIIGDQQQKELVARYGSPTNPIPARPGANSHSKRRDRR